MFLFLFCRTKWICVINFWFLIWKVASMVYQRENTNCPLNCILFQRSYHFNFQIYSLICDFFHFEIVKSAIAMAHNLHWFHSSGNRKTIKLLWWRFTQMLAGLGLALLGLANHKTQPDQPNENYRSPKDKSLGNKCEQCLCECVCLCINKTRFS